jgi:hypothetical protein
LLVSLTAEEPEEAREDEFYANLDKQMAEAPPPVIPV